MPDPVPIKHTHVECSHYVVRTENMKGLEFSPVDVWTLSWTWRTFRVHEVDFEKGFVVLRRCSIWQSIKDRIKL